MSDFQCIWLGQMAGLGIPLDRLHRGSRQASRSHYSNLLALKAKAGNFAYRAYLLLQIRRPGARVGDGPYSRKYELTAICSTEPVITVPQHNPADGITAVRSILGVSWFDEAKCRRGLARLSILSTQQEWDAECTTT